MKRCCTGLGTLWKVSRAGEILWRRDHFAGWDAAEEAVNAGRRLGPLPLQSVCVSCDDAENVIVGSSPSRACRDNPDDEQPPMWTVRCYSPAGELRWSWSPAPFGWLSELTWPPVGGTVERFPPSTPIDVRLAPGRQGHAWGNAVARDINGAIPRAWYRIDGRGRSTWTQTTPPALQPDEPVPMIHWPDGPPLGHSRSWFLIGLDQYLPQSFAVNKFGHDGLIDLAVDEAFLGPAPTTSQADGIFVNGSWSGQVAVIQHHLDESPNHFIGRVNSALDASPILQWATDFEFGGGGGLLLGAPDFVGLVSAFGGYIVLHAADGSLAARGTVGEVPVIDGEVIPPTTEGLGWALAGGAMYDDDGRPLWRPAGVTVRDTAIDGDENCYFATDRGVLSIDRLDR